MKESLSTVGMCVDKELQVSRSTKHCGDLRIVRKCLKLTDYVLHFCSDLRQSGNFEVPKWVEACAVKVFISTAAD